MDQSELIIDFGRLGTLLETYLRKEVSLPLLDGAIQKSVEANYWFTDYHIVDRLTTIVQSYLSLQNLSVWLSNYSNVWFQFSTEIAIVMAGNIPLVGFHDYMSVLASGRRVSIKLSSKDLYLLPAIHELLCTLSPSLQTKVRFVTEVPLNVSGLIATGSDGTASWFNKHYAQLPKIVRGHRVSAAVIPLDITDDEIKLLHRDMFLYFGLGCRSVVRLFVPDRFDLSRLIDCACHSRESLHQGFKNSYKRQKALLTLLGTPFTDGRFFLLQQTSEWNPPLATVYYTYYHSINEVIMTLEEAASQMQCVVGRGTDIKNCITFGSAQNPQLWDYANGIDTMKL
ncbi:MAG: hypothetical protein LBC84_05115 [Prevotellaceae bacterium]|jgi:hypothetical protein|nr:hypothetical protein [Prevotellaceae bacterium]